MGLMVRCNIPCKCGYATSDLHRAKYFDRCPATRTMEYVTPQGIEIPALGFGTARMESEAEHRRAIDEALEAGYRHFDTAQRYGSEPVLGAAIADAPIQREDLFITTKLDDHNRAYDAVIESTMESIEHLGLDYLDLLLNHWPNPEYAPPDAETIAAMNDLRDDGLVAHIGVANHSVDNLRHVIEISDAPILTAQERYNLLDRERARGGRGDSDDDLRQFCIEKDVALVAYSPLGVGEVLNTATTVEIADRYEKTPAQVALRWLIQQPMVAAIPFSRSPTHIRENIEIFDFELSSAEMRELFALGESLDDGRAAILGM